MQLSNKIKTIVFILLSYLTPLFLHFLLLKIFGIGDILSREPSPFEKYLWIEELGVILVALALAYYAYLSLHEKAFENGMRTLRFIIPSLIVISDILMGLLNFQIAFLSTFIYMALIIVLFVVKENSK